MYRADEKGIMFHTGSFKDPYKQMQQNPNVELCFGSADRSKQVRVSWKSEFIEDQSLKEGIANKRSFLKPWVEWQGYDMLKVFRVTNCAATIRAMAANFEPTKYVRL